MKRVPDKQVSINLNVYRNWHHNFEGTVKKEYTRQLEDQLEGLNLPESVEVTYKVFKPTLRRLDKGNVLSITQKYFLDALVFYKCIPDDNDDYIGREIFERTELDRDNPRVEITLKSIAR